MRRVRHTASFEIEQPVDALFPLFSAEGEKHWVPGWDYRNIMGSTELYEDYVFTTRDHAHGASEAIWLVKRHDTDRHFVEFYKVEPGEKVGIISVKCDSISSEKSSVTVTYEYIALGEAGSIFITNFTAEDYERFIGSWKDLLDEYFQRQ